MNIETCNIKAMLCLLSCEPYYTYKHYNDKSTGLELLIVRVKKLNFFVEQTYRYWQKYTNLAFSYSFSI